MKALFTRSIPFLLLPVVAACGGDSSEPPPDQAVAVADAPEMQDLIQLPADFSPEGIAVDEDFAFYVGSLAPPTAGQILKGDLRTGDFFELVAPTGVSALGIRHDPRSNYIFVAGGGTSSGHVYTADTGAEVASFQFGAAPSMINDVEITPMAAYFTDSQLPNLYRVALDSNGEPGDWTTVALHADFEAPGTTQCTGVAPIRGNGIASTGDGRYLIINHMSRGTLYRVDTQSGAVEPIPLSGGDLCSADGLLLEGTTLYAVQNTLNRVAVVELSPDYTSATVTRLINEPFASNPAIKVPTTIGEQGGSLYAVTAGFADPAPDYVVRINKMP